MAERCLLHKSKLQELKQWLESQGYTILETKDYYEVLRAKKDKNLIIIYKKSDVKEHLTVQQKDDKLIRRFIRESKKARGSQ